MTQQKVYFKVQQFIFESILANIGNFLSNQLRWGTFITKKRSISVIILVVTSQIIIAQNNQSIIGTIVDSETRESVYGATITIGDYKVFTDIDGRFSLPVEVDKGTIICTCIGYQSLAIDIPETHNLGIIEMRSESHILPDAIITSQLAIPRKTPIAVSNVLASQIEERLGNDEFVETLKYSPGVHANRQGGSWADSEIFVRGFDNTNVATMINGIPVNDMENGTVYWSNWASLSEVTSVLQVQRGIGATKLSASSVGGTINIVTKGIETKKGGSFSYSLGNDGYQRTSFSSSTGLMDNGWSVNILGSYTRGDGYASGTDFKVYTYFANISKFFTDKHLLNLNVFGAAQEHHSRSNALTKSNWEMVRTTYSQDKDWRRYNPDYGFSSTGQRKTADFNKYNMPFLTLKHQWQINEKSNLTTTAYAALGNGGGYDGKADETNCSEYDWYGSDYGQLNLKFRASDGTFDYSRIEEINASSTNGSEMIMTRIRGKQNWYGLLSIYSSQVLGCIDWFAGIDSRYYKNQHTNEIVDLFGGAYYIDPCRSEVNISNNSKATDAWKDQHLGVGDVVYRDYDSFILQNGVFAQAEYNKNDISAFLSGSLNLTDYWRYDRLYNTGSNAKSETKGFWCGNIKGGINYNINKHNNIFFNIGYNSKAPQFKSGVFMSATSSNVTNDNVKNEKSFSTEFGYSLHHKWLVLKANTYYTKWVDKSMTKKGKLTEQYYINMTGVNSRHLGLEFEVNATPAQWVETGAMLSLGNWKWDSDNVKGYAYTLSGQAVTSDGSITIPGAANHAYALINMRGIHIGGSAQTTAAVDMTFKPFTGFRIGGGYTYFSRNFAYYSLSGNSLKLGEEIFVVEPWEIPSYGCFDIWGSYKFLIGKLHAKISGQINNVFNNYYIEKAWNPATVSREVVSVNPDDVYLFYSIGRTWTVKLRIDF